MKTSNINQADTAEIFHLLDELVDGWCARRALRPLRIILQIYPLGMGLTDDWNNLYNCLRDAYSGDLPEHEQEKLHRATVLTQSVINVPRC